MNPAGYLLDHLPAGPERDRALELVRLGLRFQSQHVGRRPGHLRRFLETMVAARPGHVSFERLLSDLEFAARRRELLGEAASPVEKIDREWEIVTYHDGKRGRRQFTFKHLRNLLCTIQQNPRMP